MEGHEGSEVTDPTVEEYKRPNLVQQKALTIGELGLKVSRLATEGEIGQNLPVAIAIGWGGYFVKEVKLINGQIWLDCFRESETE